MAREFSGGSGDKIECGSASSLDDLAVSGAFTVSAWINPDTVGENNTGRIASKRTTAGGGWLFFTDATASLGATTASAIGPAAEAESRGANNAITLGVWSHACLTYDDNDDRILHIYANGSEISYDTETAATGPNGTDASGDFKIGQTSETDDDRTFDGEIAEVAVWNRILTSGEISGLAAKHSPEFYPNQLISHWRLIRGLQDYVGGNDGTATNTTITEQPPIIRPAQPFYTVPAVAAPITQTEGPLIKGRLIRGGSLSGSLIR